MNFVLSFCVLLCISISNELETSGSTNRQCYKAKTCVHDNIEKCGVTGNGSPRRFLDSCDIFEYNCLQNTDYTRQSTMEKCKTLSSLYIDSYNANLDESEKAYGNAVDEYQNVGPNGKDYGGQADYQNPGPGVDGYDGQTDYQNAGQGDEGYGGQAEYQNAEPGGNGYGGQADYQNAAPGGNGYGGQADYQNAGPGQEMMDKKKEIISQ